MRVNFIGVILQALVQVSLLSSALQFITLIFHIAIFSGCDCNLSGTSGGSSMCDEDTGMCTCAASLGYSGGENNKCDACLDGWIWTASDSTCTGKFFFFSK